MLNEVANAKIKRTIQTVTYMPYFISTVVFVGMINSFLSPSLGLLGVLYRALGQTPPYLLGDPSQFRGINVVSGIWQTAGWNSVVYLSAITAIDPPCTKRPRWTARAFQKDLAHYAAGDQADPSSF